MSRANPLLAAGNDLACFAVEVASEARRASGDPKDGDYAMELANAWIEAVARQRQADDGLRAQAHTLLAGFEAVLAAAEARGIVLADQPALERIITEAQGAARAIERASGARQPAPGRSVLGGIAPSAAPDVQPIPGDICRCHDADCPANATCRRWLIRDTGAGPSPHSWSLREPQNPWADHEFHADPWEVGQGAAPADPCPYYLPHEAAADTDRARAA